MSETTGAHPDLHLDLAGLSPAELLARFHFYWLISGAAGRHARELLAALSAAGMNWSELEDETGMSRPAVKRHVHTANHGGRTRIFGAKPSADAVRMLTLLEQVRRDQARDQAREQQPARRAP
jgi:hypothetical protein